MKTKADLAKFIRTERVSQKLTQAEMANRLGITQGRYAQIENDYEDVSFDVLIKTFPILGYVVEIEVEKH